MNEISPKHATQTEL